ncbi:ABC transporter transmembrane domain-containing protein [Hoeflea poritis]|uniref:ABC transporter transmembrane domain-containing protein n=1 Tax=Hoeflea poritis TaxID=2993659 RepID=A0ABT4VJI0_9HYPH|nr:ABC transporter transmembrane domain-containing protein [Hoeflea poritis]MDA4844282.1 ABC transporter transmembrane domain-containing protein [Hoeflea poritis]
MAVPALWTRRRLLQLSGLACLGVAQAGAALAVAAAGSRLLTQVEDAPSQHWLTGTVIAAAMVLIVVRVAQRRFAEAFALGYVTELRVALMSHVIRIPADSRPPRTGLVMTRVVNDLSAIKLWLASGLVAIVVAVAALSAVTATLIIFEPGIAIVLAFAFALWAVPVVLCLRPLRRRIRESRRQRGRIAARAGGILAARLTLLGFGRHGSTVRGLKKKSDHLNAALVARATLSGLLRSSGDLVFPAVVLFAAGGRLIFETEAFSAVSLGVLVVMAALAATHLSAVALGLEYRLAYRIALDRIEAVLRLPAIDPDAGQRLQKREAGRAIEARGLRLEPGDRQVDFSAVAGEAVALSGLTEDQATDLVMKLGGLKRVGAGCVFLDGCDAVDIRARNWWREVTIVSPHLRLIKASVAVNARLGARSGDDEELKRVLARFGLPPGHEAMAIGEDGECVGAPVTAIRAARAVMRQSGLVLIADRELVADEVLSDAFFGELHASGATIVVAAPLPAGLSRRFRIIDFDASQRRVA